MNTNKNVLLLLSFFSLILFSQKIERGKTDFFTKLNESRYVYLTPTNVAKEAKQELFFTPPITYGAEFSIRIISVSGVYFLDGVFFKENYTDMMFENARSGKSLDVKPSIERRMFNISSDFEKRLQAICEQLKQYEYASPPVAPNEILHDDTPLYEIIYAQGERVFYAASKKRTGVFDKKVYHLFMDIAKKLKDGTFSEQHFEAPLDEILEE